MRFSEYTAVAAKTANYPNKNAFLGLLYTVIGLSGEAGELSNKVKKIMRDDAFKISEELRQDLLSELGDCCWYLDRIANELGSTLEEVALMNNDKLMSRLDRGAIGGSGDHR